WKNITTVLNTATNMVCGRTTSFSPFAVMQKTGFNFSGFLVPVSMTTLNVVKAGAGVPLKFSLGGDKGLGVIAPGYPTSTAIACSGAPTGSEITGASAGSSSLNYDASSGQYTYV